MKELRERYKVHTHLRHSTHRVNTCFTCCELSYVFIKFVESLCRVQRLSRTPEIMHDGGGVTTEAELKNWIQLYTSSNYNSENKHSQQTPATNNLKREKRIRGKSMWLCSGKLALARVLPQLGYIVWNFKCGTINLYSAVAVNVGSLDTKCILLYLCWMVSPECSWLENQDWDERDREWPYYMCMKCEMYSFMHNKYDRTSLMHMAYLPLVPTYEKRDELLSSFQTIFFPMQMNSARLKHTQEMSNVMKKKIPSETIDEARPNRLGHWQRAHKRRRPHWDSHRGWSNIINYERNQKLIFGRMKTLFDKYFKCIIGTFPIFVSDTKNRPHIEHSTHSVKCMAGEKEKNSGIVR